VEDPLPPPLFIRVKKIITENNLYVKFPGSICGAALLALAESDFRESLKVPLPL
jgi:hypothetical protein